MIPPRSAEEVVRDAELADVAAICAFGEAHIRPHYTPLLGAAAADAQVRRWWNEGQISTAVDDRLVVVADVDGQLVGVGQRGRWGRDHVVYKLYIHPEYRGHGLGRRLLGAIFARLPPDTDRVFIEHFAANERAGAFYEREGFPVDRIEPSPTGQPALAQVWRVRRLRSELGVGSERTRPPEPPGTR